MSNAFDGIKGFNEAAETEAPAQVLYHLDPDTDLDGLVWNKQGINKVDHHLGHIDLDDDPMKCLVWNKQGINKVDHHLGHIDLDDDPMKCLVWNKQGINKAS